MSLGGDAYVFVSSDTKNPEKNPLPSSLKVEVLNAMFPSGVTFVDTATCDPKCGGPVAAHAFLLEKGYTDITLVAGSDRAPLFNESADMWKSGLKQDPPISPPRFVGLERESRGAGAEAMSGTKARALARAGNKAAFAKAVAVGALSEDDPLVHTMYRVIQGTKKGGRRGRTTRLTRSKASGRALSRRGLRSRSGS
jgi:hypothetical protein